MPAVIASWDQSRANPYKKISNSPTNNFTIPYEGCECLCLLLAAVLGTNNFAGSSFVF
jgi:hypothetical protein